jgi:hypothetical protein
MRDSSIPRIDVIKGIFLGSRSAVKTAFLLEPKNRTAEGDVVQYVVGIGIRSNSM